MKKLSYDKLLKFIILLFAVFIMDRASLFRSINPFGISFCFALIFSKINPICVITGYFFSNIIFDFSSSILIITLAECSVMALILLIEKLLKKKLKNYVYAILILISQSANIYFSSGVLENFIEVLASVFVSFISYFIFTISLTAFVKRGRIFKFTLDEKVCHAVLVICFFSGVAGIYLGQFIVTNIISLAILFFISRVAPASFTICFSSLAGLGVSLYSSNIIPLGLFSIWATMMITFSKNKKIVTSIMVLASDVVIGIFLNAYAVYDLWVLISTLIGLLIVCIFPDKKLDSISAILGKHVDIAKDFASLKHEEAINKKLKNISAVFFEMENVYRTLLLGEMDKTSAIEYIAAQSIVKSCKNCEKYKSCFMGSLDMKSAFKSLSHAGVNKGKVTIIDTPNLLNSDCHRISNVISNVNSSLLNLNKIIEDNKKIDKSNIQVASQLSATGELISNISKQFNKNLNIDYLKSSDLYEELLYNDVHINDVVCVIGAMGIECVILSVASSDVINPLILYSVEKILKIKCKINERIMSKVAGYTILTIIPSCNYVSACGVATLSKNNGENSGDCYSVIKIDESKYFYAIADGMGSGKNASIISNATISLIENYYKAGFDSDTIIESVNNILLPSGREEFSTLDSAIIDTNSGRVDFIKIGSTVSVIKGANESKLVECESLPLGIVNMVKPTTKSYYIESGDIIVLASDGVVDSFSSIESFMDFINNERIFNVQLLADNILEEATCRNKSHKDDMTVLAIKVSKSY